MTNASSAALRKRRHQLVRALPPLEQIVRGSLMETYKPCGRPSCHCVDGPGHGPKRYLSTIARTGERPRLGYVPHATNPKSLRFSPTTANYRRCSTRFARSMPSFCVAARVSTKWIRLSQRSILPTRAPSSPTCSNPILPPPPCRSTRKEPIMLNPKIADHHLMRKACIYIRQSTLPPHCAGS